MADTPVPLACNTSRLMAAYGCRLHPSVCLPACLPGCISVCVTAWRHVTTSLPLGSDEHDMVWCWCVCVSTTFALASSHAFPDAIDSSRSMTAAMAATCTCGCTGTGMFACWLCFTACSASGPPSSPRMDIHIPVHPYTLIRGCSTVPHAGLSTQTILPVVRQVERYRTKSPCEAGTAWREALGRDRIELCCSKSGSQHGPGHGFLRVSSPGIPGTLGLEHVSQCNQPLPITELPAGSSRTKWWYPYMGPRQ